MMWVCGSPVVAIHNGPWYSKMSATVSSDGF